MFNIFIDGGAGTTGLGLKNRLAKRTDIRLMEIAEADRKNLEKRVELINSADIAFLCLPDAAAKEVAAAADASARIIDASTAHRVDPAWTYGFAELSAERRAAIAGANRLANPGCHASGMIALVYPLRAAGLLDADADVTCFSITGYSGGGKGMIADYESEERPLEFGSPRQYGVAQQHKHLPEMQTVCTLAKAPLFSPIVADYFSGMEVSVPLFAKNLCGAPSPEAVKEVYMKHYEGSPIVRVAESADSFLAANAFSGRDIMEICVSGNAERLLLTARFDNLGKGASGAAVQNMNIMLGLEETLGLEL